MCSHPGSDLLNTVLCIANSPSGIKDLEGQIELGVIRIQLHTQVVLVRYVSDWGEIKCKQLRPQDRPLWDATIKLLFVREGAVYAYSLETISQVGTVPGESLSTNACQNASRVFQEVEHGRLCQKLTTSLAKPRKQLPSCPRQGGRHSGCGTGPFLCCGKPCTLTDKAHAGHSPGDALTAVPYRLFHCPG